MQRAEEALKQQGQQFQDDWQRKNEGRATHESARKTIDEMLKQAEERQEAASSGEGRRSTPDVDSERPTAAASSDKSAAQGCCDWPHVTKDAMKKYRKKHDQRKIEEYKFLHCCQAQCIPCVWRCVREFQIDPGTCTSSGMDGIQWARFGDKEVCLAKKMPQIFVDCWKRLMHGWYEMFWRKECRVENVADLAGQEPC
eukprot:symbB.v1.2.032384.t1/scaffold3856.1/size95938/2